MSEPDYIDLTGCELKREAFTDEEWKMFEMMKKHVKRTFDDVDAILEKEGKLNRYERFNMSGGYFRNRRNGRGRSFIKGVGMSEHSWLDVKDCLPSDIEIVLGLTFYTEFPLGDRPCGYAEVPVRFFPWKGWKTLENHSIEINYWKPRDPLPRYEIPKI